MIVLNRHLIGWVKPILDLNNLDSFGNRLNLLLQILQFFRQFFLLCRHFLLNDGRSFVQLYNIFDGAGSLFVADKLQFLRQRSGWWLWNIWRLYWFLQTGILFEVILLARVEVMIHQHGVLLHIWISHRVLQILGLLLRSFFLEKSFNTYLVLVVVVDVWVHFLVIRYRPVFTER